VNPYLIGGASLALALGGFLGGWQAASWKADSEALAIERAADAAGKKATEAAVGAIERIEVRNVTIRQKAETVVREVPVYRECRHDADGLRAINEALAAGPIADPGRVSGAGAADR
jgi:hypothetical protein